MTIKLERTYHIQPNNINQSTTLTDIIRTSVKKKKKKG